MTSFYTFSDTSSTQRTIFLALAMLRFAARSGGDFGFEIRIPTAAADAVFGAGAGEVEDARMMRSLWWSASGMGDNVEKPVVVGMRTEADDQGGCAVSCELHPELIDWRMREMQMQGCEALTDNERALIPDEAVARDAFDLALAVSAGLTS